MSTALPGQPSAIQQQPSSYSPHSGHGSVGPVIGVLAVIAFFGVVAVIFGRLCSGRVFFGDRRFHLEGWVERKCAACVEGRIDNSGAIPGDVGGATVSGSGSGATVAVSVEATPESKRTHIPESQNSANSV